MFYSFKSDQNFYMNLKEENFRLTLNWIWTRSPLNSPSYLPPIEFPPLPNFPFDVFRPEVFCRVGRDSVSISMDRSKIIGEPDFSRHAMFSIFEKTVFLLLEKNVFFEAWTLLPTDLQSPFCQKSSEVAKKLKLQKYRLKLRGCRKSKVTEQITTKQMRNYQLVVNVINFLLVRFWKFPDFPQMGKSK